MPDLVDDQVDAAAERAEMQIQDAYDDLEEIVENVAFEEFQNYIDSKYTDMDLHLESFRNNLLEAANHVDSDQEVGRDEVKSTIYNAASALEMAYMSSRVIWKKTGEYLSGNSPELDDRDPFLGDVPEKTENPEILDSQEEKEEGFISCVRLLEDVADAYATEMTGYDHSESEFTLVNDLEPTKWLRHDSDKAFSRN